MHIDSPIALLKEEIFSIAAAMSTVLIIATVLISYYWIPQAILQWIFVTGILLGSVIYQTLKRVDLNRANSSSPLYSTLGWANRLTILRGGLIAATGGFLFLDWPPGMLAWLPGCLYTLAAILDRIDGFIARKTGQTSLLGIELDTLFDALGLAVAPLLAVWYGQIHWSYLLFSIAYYLFQWGIYWRKRNGLPVYTLPPNVLRRAWAGFQMGFIAVILLPVFSPPLTRIASIAFVMPVLTGFLIDWLVVSGRIDRANAKIIMLFSRGEMLIQKFLQPLLRILILILILSFISIPGTLFELTMVMMAILILAGMAGRAAALALIILSGFYYREHLFNGWSAILTFAITWVMLLGTGHHSLWKKDEDWINRYDGA